MSVDGKVAVVTGAGSGIGRALAVELCRRGARVSGCDVSLSGLEQTARLCPGVLHTAVVDVGDRDAVFAYADEVVAHHGVVHQIYNNAGIAFGLPVIESSWADYERVLRVNLGGVVHGTQAFLPHLIRSGDGHVVNVSSLNGYLAQPGSSHYCTSKFAVRGFTESLHMEMLRDRHPVKVSVVHPGGIATSIIENGEAFASEAGREVEVDEERRRIYKERLLRMDPAQAARIILAGVERGRVRIRVGSDAVLVDHLVRLLPTATMQAVVALDRRLARRSRLQEEPASPPTSNWST